jgi:hypothetical protein
MAKMTKKRTAIAVNLDKMIESADGLALKVGWFESNKYPDGTPVAGVMAVHEYGHAPQNIPPRPFLRTTLQEKRQDWAATVAKGVTAAIKGSYTIDQVLDALGGMVVGDVQVKIQSITEPPLKPATIKRKGFDKPLIQTGHAFKTITFVKEEK